jgi:hypothetical protein
MKASLVGLFTLTFSLAAHAAPDCFTVDGKETGANKDGREIVDGAFLISVDARNISKENLLLVMDKVDFGNLRADSFPQLLEDVIILSTKASTAGADDSQVDRPKLIETVNGQIDEITAIAGVKSVDCNAVQRPADRFFR